MLRHALRGFRGKFLEWLRAHSRTLEVVEQVNTWARGADPRTLQGYPVFCVVLWTELLSDRAFAMQLLLHSNEEHDVR